MTAYRLSYPATIYATVAADDLDAATQRLVDALKVVHDGIDIHLDIESLGDDDDYDPGARLYPDSDERGDVAGALVELEDVEE